MKKNAYMAIILASAAAVAACTTSTSTNDPAPTSPAATNQTSGTNQGGTAPPTGSSGGAGVTTSKIDLAKTEFWKAFYAGRYEDLEKARALAFEAYEAEPKNPEAARIAYYTQFWRAGEIERIDPTPEEEDKERGLMFKLLSEARELNKGDLAFDAWMGGNLVMAGFGRNDPQMLESGVNLLAKSRSEQPLAGGIMTGVAFGRTPANSEKFQLVLDSLFKAVEWCIGAPLDRQNPDLAPHMSKWTDAVPYRACWSNKHTPHFQEGFWAEMGDFLVKAGEVGAARVAYNNVKLTPSFETWKEKSTLEARLTADLDARAALYRDADEENDPPLGIGNSCTGCHSN